MERSDEENSDAKQALRKKHKKTKILINHGEDVKKVKKHKKREKVEDSSKETTAFGYKKNSTKWGKI